MNTSPHGRFVDAVGPHACFVEGVGTRGGGEVGEYDYPHSLRNRRRQSRPTLQRSSRCELLLADEVLLLLYGGKETYVELFIMKRLKVYLCIMMD